MLYIFCKYFNLSRIFCSEIFQFSQNNFKAQVLHIIVNNIIADNIKVEKIIDNVEIKSLTLEIKFICLNKSLIDDISDEFKKNNLIVSNIYCSSYVRSFFYKKHTH